MKKISILLAAASLLAVATVTGVTGIALAGAKNPQATAAAHGPRGPVGKRGPRGPAGHTGPRGPAGHAGPAGPAGPKASAGFNDFSKLVPFNGTESLTIGQFTISEVAGPSSCNTIKLVDNSSFNAEVSIIEGADKTTGPGQYLAVPAAGSTTIANANVAAGDVATFSAVLVNGSSSLTGTAGGLALGTGCLVSGTITGS